MVNEISKTMDFKLKPYTGESHPEVDITTLHGKVVCGYQGWFNAPGDGADMQWGSWDGRNHLFRPGSCTIDMWPDMSELGEDERYETEFKLPDGRKATVFSAHNRKTVLRHFRWMREYGIDTAFVQRFIEGLTKPVIFNHRNTVLAHCREGANLYGRSYSVMYDLSGMKANSIHLVIDDWKRLVDQMGITRDSQDRAYQHHRGKPVVTIWGIGFNDGREYSLEECLKLVEFFKEDSCYGNNTIMLGVPTGWREQSEQHFYRPKIEERFLVMDGDSQRDPLLHEIIKKADIVSPWTVDRFRDDEGAEYIARQIWKQDLDWCILYGLEFMPVVFPGFSWSNLNSGEKFNAIPRRKGEFLWKQYYECVRLGVPMIYQAMFDEVNEGTAIFKCTNNPPAGENKFVDYEGLPSDHYLWLVGQGGKMLRREIPLTAKIPTR